MESFSIKKNPVAVSIEVATMPNVSKYKEVYASEDTESDNTIYFMPQSLKSLDRHFSWGQKNDRNVVEQGGILIGQVFTDTITNNLCGIVFDVISAKNAPSNKTYLSLTPSVWNAMYNEFDNKYQSKKSYKIIGWYHTHPNDLKVFMSGVDVDTQKKFFKEDWQFSVVFNPHRKIWKAFCGEKCKECRGIFLLDGSFYDTEFNPALNPQHIKNVNQGDEINNKNSTSFIYQNEEYIKPENDRKSGIKKKDIEQIKKMFNCTAGLKKRRHQKIIMEYAFSYIEDTDNPSQRFINLFDCTPCELICEYNKYLSATISFSTPKLKPSQKIRVEFSKFSPMEKRKRLRYYKDLSKRDTSLCFFLHFNIKDVEDYHFYNIL